MAIGGFVSVGTSPTQIAAVAISSPRKAFCLQNVSDADVFLGGSDVTSSDYGHKLAAGSAITLDINSGDDIYGVVASGSKNVAVLEVGTR